MITIKSQREIADAHSRPASAEVLALMQEAVRLGIITAE